MCIYIVCYVHILIIILRVDCLVIAYVHDMGQAYALGAIVLGAARRGACGRPNREGHRRPPPPWGPGGWGRPNREGHRRRRRGARGGGVRRESMVN